MKSIDKKDFITIGTVVKTHGTKGELKLSFDRENKLKKWAFLEIQGKPVPFYMEEVHSLPDNEAFVKFEDVDSMEQAAKYTGLDILSIKPKAANRKKNEVDHSIIGYRLADKTEGDIGELTELRELPGQLMFVVARASGDEILIPAVDNFILDINDRDKVIDLDLPEGLLDI